MIKNLSPNNKKKLPSTFQHSLQQRLRSWSVEKNHSYPPCQARQTVWWSQFLRPTSLTSCFRKIFERIITNRLSWFVEHQNLLSPEQAGFWKQHSTTDNLIKLDYGIKSGLLLYKLGKLGIRGICLGWITNIIHNRSICVRLCSHHSDSKPISKCVPQGSVISPILLKLMLYHFPNPPPKTSTSNYT
jgi:hypothetical protein